MHLRLCHVTQTILHFSIPIMTISMFGKLFWWCKCQPWVPLFGELQSCWIQVIDWNNASMVIGAPPISAQIISWGTDDLYYSLIDDFLEILYCDIIKLHLLALSPHPYLCLPKILYSTMENELWWSRLFFFTRFTELNQWAAQRAVPVRTNVEISHSVKTRKSKLLR